jgi:hypothetical protein
MLLLLLIPFTFVANNRQIMTFALLVETWESFYAARAAPGLSIFCASTLRSTKILCQRVNGIADNAIRPGTRLSRTRKVCSAHF